MGTGGGGSLVKTVLPRSRKTTTKTILRVTTRRRTLCSTLLSREASNELAVEPELLRCVHLLDGPPIRLLRLVISL